MKKYIKKMKNNSGESIGETLVALLIAAFALVMLAGAIMITSKIISSSSTKIDNYFNDSNSKLVKMTSASSGNVIISEKTDSGSTGVQLMTIPVKYGKVSELGSNNPVIAFKISDNQ